MSCFVVTEWNCKLYEDSITSVVGVFHELKLAEEFIKGQPKVIDDKYLSRSERECSEKERWARFHVEEFNGPNCRSLHRAKAADGTLYRDKSYA